MKNPAIFSSINILNFFKKESKTSWKNILVLATISGLANGSLLAIINMAAQATSNKGVEVRLFFLFIIAFLLAIIGKRYAMKKATDIVENIIKEVRTRIADKIRRTELLFFESLEESYLYSRITQDTNIISQSCIFIINSCQAIIILFLCLFYIAWLSKMALFIIVGSITVMALAYKAFRKETESLLLHATQKETELFEIMSHILKGFKELKINQKKSDDLFNHFREIADATSKIKISTSDLFIRDFVFSQSYFYAIMAIIVFILPSYTAAYSQLIVQLVVAVMFLTGPLEMAVGSLSMFARANVAVYNLYKLESELDKSPNGFPTVEPIDALREDSFQSLHLEKIEFNYRDTGGKVLFRVGPVDLTIKSGEALFIVGGNGSGKTTLLKLLSGLYFPQGGHILLDNEILQPQEFQAYRELFSIIFTDFHLFDRLYGLRDIEPKKVNDLIEVMELNKKTSYKEGKFTDVKLSTGQRKRLAMIASFLDDKPIFLFDEVVADQDPQFRQYFYEVLLKNLLKKGKTVIAATHDDKYFHVADRVIKMDYGKII